MAVDWDKVEHESHRQRIADSREGRDHKFTEAELDRGADVAQEVFNNSHNQTTWGDAANAGIASIKVNRERG